jgi:hypothetical protein
MSTAIFELYQIFQSDIEHRSAMLNISLGTDTQQQEAASRQVLRAGQL